MVPPYFRFKLDDLKTLSNLSNNSITLGPRQYKMLYHLAENPATSAYDISPVRKYKSETGYTEAKGRINQLKNLKLIEEVIKYPNIHNARYWKISSRGVYYLIANNTSLQDGILKSLLANYGDHPLFRYFLYPCIESDTLLKVSDSIPFHTFSYLHDCCKKAEETMYMINRTYNQQNGKVTRPLFSWNNISKEDKNKIRSLLKQRFRLDWVDNAEIKKTEGGNSISITYGLNSALIILNKDKTIATLSSRGRKLLEFDVKGSNVWTSEPSEHLQTTSLEEFYMRFFNGFLQMRVQQFIFSILLN